METTDGVGKPNSEDGRRSNDDRTVHGQTATDWLIVRYDRAGKWFMERGDHKHRLISLKAAVWHATQRGSCAYLGRPGGKSFDAAVRRAS